MASTTQKNGTENSAPFKIEKVQSWRATLRRATAWKTARYTKGDIEATGAIPTFLQEIEDNQIPFPRAKFAKPRAA